MPLKGMIENLKQLKQSYEPFWSEWLKQEDCSLNTDDIYIIQVHDKNQYKISLFDSFMFYNQKEHIEKINAKLRWDVKKFKQWVILNFLFSIIELARKKGGQNYLHKPIGTLDLNKELKAVLCKMDLLYLNQIFEKYREEDLEKEKFFKLIVEFENIMKNVLPVVKLG